MIIEGYFYLSLKPCVVTPYLNRLIETVQIRGHNIFLCRIYKNYLVLIINKYSILSRALRVYIVYVTFTSICASYVLIFRRVSSVTYSLCNCHSQL